MAKKDPWGFSTSSGDPWGASSVADASLKLREKDKDSEFSASSLRNKAKKKREEEERKRKQEEEQKKQSEKKLPRGIIQQAGDVVAGASKALAEGITASYKRIGEGNAEVLNEISGNAQKERDAKAASDADTMKTIKTLGNRIKSAKTDEEKERARKALANVMKIDDKQSSSFQKRQEEIAERTDPAKGAGAAASIGLDLVTAGTVGSAVKAAKTGQIFRKADTVAETGLKIATKKGAKDLAKNAGKGAALGGTYGVTGTLENQGSEANADDYALNAAFGAGIGAAIPMAGAGIVKGAKGTKNAVDKISSHMADKKAANKVASGETNDLNKVMNQQIAEQSEKYGKGVATRVKEFLGDQFNPLRSAAKLDDAYAKANGIKRNKLNAEDSVEDAMRRSAQSEGEASGLFYQPLDVDFDVTRTNWRGKQRTEKPTAQYLVEKYKGDSPEGKEFNNYTNAKFDLEFRAKKGGNKRIQNQFSDEELQKFVDDYETRNPEAVQDAKIKKAVNNIAVDYLEKNKVISSDEASQIKNSYEFAVPLERIFPDDLARPEVVGRNIGSIAKQTVIQKLEGGSDIPLSNSFNTMINRVYKAVSQGNRAKVAQMLAERQHLIPGAKMTVTAGNKEARKELREISQIVNKGIRVLDNKIKISNRHARQIASELNSLNKEGLDISLKEGGKTTLPGFSPEALNKLASTKGKTVSSRQFFKSLVESDPRDLQRVRDKIATREPKLAAKLDEVANMRTRIDSLKATKTDLKDVAADFVDDPTTGKQLISGVIDGQTFKMEVPPDLAKAAMGMDQQKLGPVLKAAAIAKKPFEVAWTGILNPVFSGVSFAFYDTPMSIINSPQGFKTLAPKAVIESFKSLKASSEFQQMLAKNGVRPYGGSGASTFIKPDAKTLASQRNILSKIAYNSTHPDRILSRTDVWGGKLAGMTRTRVARAAYDDAIRIARKNGEDITSDAVKKRAMGNATLAYRTIMPDFDTMSNLTRQINAFVPFYAASLAGTRSFGQALRRDPVGTSAKALTLGIAPAMGITAFSLMQPKGQEFYRDMEDSGKKHILDNNMVVVLPGAEKDKKTGEWKGIIKIPLAPEFRAINQSAWRGVRGAMGKGDGPGASQIALSIFDSVTGGVRTSENPLVTSLRIISGQDPNTGKQIVPPHLADLPKEEQIYKNTSDAGKFAGNLFGISGIQGDKLLNQFGIPGRIATRNEDPVEATAETAINRVSGAYGEKATTAFYNSFNPANSARQKASKQVTDLIKQNKRNQARRVAEEYNETLTNRFSKLFNDYHGTSAYDDEWDDRIESLFIKTTDKAFDARLKKK